MSGRIRTLKPEWLEDELLAECSSDARVLSVGLLLEADDHGNGRAGVNGLTGRVFPGKPREVLANALEELRAIRFVLLYEVDGQHYFAIRNWLKHQKVDHPGKPKVPGPDSGIVHDPPPLEKVRESLAKAPESLAPDRDQEGTRKGPGREGSAPAAPAPPPKPPRAVRRCPPEWQPKQEHRDLAEQRGVDFELELAKLRDHEFAKPRSDWDAVFRNWLREARVPAKSQLRVVGGLSPAMEKLRREAQGIE